MRCSDLEADVQLNSSEREDTEPAVPNRLRRLSDDLDRRQGHATRFPPFDTEFRSFRDGSVGCPSNGKDGGSCSPD